MAKKNSKKTVPELRFRGFTDPWEQRQLREVAQRVTQRNLNNECSRVLTASAEAGLIDQQEYFQKRVA
ncbi:MAG: restriction endonuclease subunit S, partial [Bifidobacterium boum]|nr:restriction endonuclease subunit S [Bifidobacterium boum]